MHTVFDNHHVKEYYEVHIVALMWLVDAPAYDGLLYRYTLCDRPPEARLYAPRSLADITVATGVVTSMSSLRRLIRQHGISATNWNEPYTDWFAVLPKWETEYLVRKGLRALEVAVEWPVGAAGGA